KVNPRDERGEIKNGIGQAGRGQFGKAAKEQSEDQHGKQRLQDHPSDADDSLLVADFDVAPNEEIKELSVAPKLGEAKLQCSSSRLNADDGGNRVQRKLSG